MTNKERDEYAQFVLWLYFHSKHPEQNKIHRAVEDAADFHRWMLTLKRLNIAHSERGLDKKQQAQWDCISRYAYFSAKVNYGAEAIIGGDIRGCPLRLKWPEGPINSWDGETYLVP